MMEFLDPQEVEKLKNNKLGQRQSQTPFSSVFWVQKEFGYKKMLGPKEIQLKKMGSQKCWFKKKFVPKKLWVQKLFDLTCLI